MYIQSNIYVCTCINILGVIDVLAVLTSDLIANFVRGLTLQLATAATIYVRQ